MFPFSTPMESFTFQTKHAYKAYQAVFAAQSNSVARPPCYPEYPPAMYLFGPVPRVLMLAESAAGNRGGAAGGCVQRDPGRHVHQEDGWVRARLPTTPAVTPAASPVGGIMVSGFIFQVFNFLRL
jgi:hypothetical protein